MTLSDQESIGSFVGGIAVLLSFVFLAVQMRQSSRTTTSSAMGAWLGDYASLQFKMSGGQQWWSVMRAFTSPDFMAFMDELIAGSPSIGSAMPWFVADAEAIAAKSTSP